LEAAAVALLEPEPARAPKREQPGRSRPKRAMEFAPPESKRSGLRCPKRRAQQPLLARARETERTVLE